MLYDSKLDQPLETKVLTPRQVVLMKAAQHLRKYGWIQNRAIESNGAACMLGAIYAQGKGDHISDAVRSLEEYLGVPAVWLFNDKPGRTKETVIAALEACALSSGK